MLQKPVQRTLRQVNRTSGPERQRIDRQSSWACVGRKSLYLLRPMKITKQRTIFVFMAAGLLACGNSTVLADESPKADVAPKWESSAFAGLTLTRGNSETVLFSANVKTQRKDKDNEWALGADATYGENNSVKNNETIHGFGQYNRLFNERFYGYARLDALHDAIADVDYRISLSPGAGYYLIKTNQTTLAVEVGPGVIHEKRGSKDETYLTLRVGERFEHKFNDTARLWQTLEYLPQVERFQNSIVNAEVGVEAALNKKLSLSVVLQDTYDNEPAPGRKKNDLKLISGLTYKF